MFRVAIVGGGIAGLTLAYRLLDDPRIEVTVFEAGARAGGTIGTWSNLDGFRVETGPEGFLDSRQPVLDLVGRLGLTDQLVSASPKARKRFTVWQGTLHEVPSSPISLLRSRLLSTRGKLRLLTEGLARTPAATADESVAAFAKRRLGREVAERLVDPAVTGVFAGDASALSLHSAFPRISAFASGHATLTGALLARLRGRRREPGSSQRGGLGKLTSFRLGMMTLTEALGAALGPRLQTKQSVAALSRHASEWQLQLPSGATRTADAIVLAVPSWAAATLLSPLDAALAETLAAIPYAPVAVVALGFRRDQITHPLDGFGVVFPSAERVPLLGCLWPSSLFAGRSPDHHVLLRCLVGGTRFAEAATWEEDHLEATVLAVLQPLLGITGSSCLRHIVRWPSAIPQYTLGHSQRLAAIEARLADLPRLFLAGNAYRGVGMADCIDDANVLAERLKGLVPVR